MIPEDQPSSLSLTSSTSRWWSQCFLLYYLMIYPIGLVFSEEFLFRFIKCLTSRDFAFCFSCRIIFRSQGNRFMDCFIIFIIDTVSFVLRRDKKKKKETLEVERISQHTKISESFFIASCNLLWLSGIIITDSPKTSSWIRVSRKRWGWEKKKSEMEEKNRDRHPPAS